MKWLREYAERQRARQQLMAMTDRDLSDIGITRGDIERVIRGGER